MKRIKILGCNNVVQMTLKNKDKKYLKAFK